MKATSQRRVCVSLRTYTAVAALVAGSLTLFTGCTSAYSEQMEATRQRLSLVARFDVLTKTPQVIPGAPATIRLPKEFTSNQVQGQLIPAFLPLPGSSVKSEILLQTQNKPTPIVAYLGTIEKRTPQDTANVLAGLHARMNEKFPGTPNWEPPLGTAPKMYPTPTGKSTPWRSLKTSGAMPLGATGETLPCTVELYVNEGEHALVWMAIQKPEGVQTPPTFGTDVPLSLGSVVTQPLPAWTFDESQVANLSEPQQIGPSKVRVPNKYVRATDPPKAPQNMQMTVFRKDPKYQLQLFAVTIAPYADTAALGDYANQMLAFRRASFVSMSLEPSAMGTIGETTGFQVPYYGRVDNQDMKGSVTVYRHARHVVIVEAIDFSFDAVTSGPITEAAARSITF